MVSIIEESMVQLTLAGGRDAWEGIIKRRGVSLDESVVTNRGLEGLLHIQKGYHTTQVSVPRKQRYGAP